MKLNLNLATISVLVGLATQRGGGAWYLSQIDAAVASNSANIQKIQSTLDEQPYDHLNATVESLNSRVDEISMTDLLTLFQMSGDETKEISDRISELEKLNALIELKLEMLAVQGAGGL